MKLVSLLLLTIIFTYGCSEKKASESVTTKDTVSLNQFGAILSTNTETHEEYYPDGKLKIKGALKNGKREGQWISWYENGQEWSECTYKNGKKDGAIASWYENGIQRYEGVYKNDIKIGEWKYWNEKGEPSNGTTVKNVK